MLLLLSGLLYVVNCSVLYYLDVTMPRKLQIITVCCLDFGQSSIVTVALVALMWSVALKIQVASRSELHASWIWLKSGIAVSFSIFANSKISAPAPASAKLERINQTTEA